MTATGHQIAVAGAYCGPFDDVYGFLTETGLHKRCRACGQVWRWFAAAADFVSIDVGPCRAALASTDQREDG